MTRKLGGTKLALTGEDKAAQSSIDIAARVTAIQESAPIPQPDASPAVTSQSAKS